MATKNPKQVVATFLILVLLLLGGIGVAIWRQRTPGVQGVFVTEPTAIGTATPLQIELKSEASNVRSYRASWLEARLADWSEGQREPAGPATEVMKATISFTLRKTSSRTAKKSFQSRVRA